MPTKSVHTWEFKARFRRSAFGWRSQPALLRVKQAVAEIRKVARKDPVLAAEGSVLFLERVSPALENVDSSSGAIGTAVNHAIDELVPIIAGADVDAQTRGKWLQRLYDAHADDGIPYIELLADHWGELCVSREIASHWADELLDITRMALSPDPNLRGHYHGTPACLSALLHAQRYDELIELLQAERFWHYRIWAARAMAAQGRPEEAIRFAEASRSPWDSDSGIDRFCEDTLHAMGRADEAYIRYGVRPHRGGTYLATFRAACRRYPEKPPREVLEDLARSTPGQEGKWFAAAKDAGLYEEALALASTTPCDPRTLTRAARDYLEKAPTFAVGAGVLALHWLLQGYGYEIAPIDVLVACSHTRNAAERLGVSREIAQQIRAMVGNRNDDMARTIRGRFAEEAGP